MEYDKRQVQDTREYINDTDGNIVSFPMYWMLNISFKTKAKYIIILLACQSNGFLTTMGMRSKSLIFQDI